MRRTGAVPMDWVFESDAISMPPCERCGRDFVFARVLPTRHIILYCAEKRGAEPEHARKWFDRTAIPNGEFTKGGAFASAVPTVHLGKNPRNRSLEIPQGVKSRVLSTQPVCVDCGIAPCSPETHNNDLLLAKWLQEYCPALLAKLVETNSKHSLNLKPNDWRLHVARVNNDLIAEIIQATKSSQLKVDHGIPKKYLLENFERMPWIYRMFATGQLVFSRCEKHNLAKSSKLPERQDLLDKYIRHYHHDQVAVARASVTTWELLTGTLNFVYGDVAGVA